MKKARLLLLDVKDGTGFKEVECGKLADYYKNLKCSTFDITCRKINGKIFDIFCDDEGLFEEHPIPSAIYPSLEPALVGNLIFAHHDSEGNTTSISDEDIALIKDHSVYAVDADNAKTWEMVCIDFD